MTYTQLALLSVVIVVLLDLFLLKTRLITRKGYWTAYSIILFFQLITNWWLTSRGILTYDEATIIGVRIASAPVEDLLFGFSMVTLTMALWVYWGKKGIQRN
jgi:lycopene cyclase domain-containing protein